MLFTFYLLNIQGKVEGSDNDLLVSPILGQSLPLIVGGKSFQPRYRRTQMTICDNLQPHYRKTQMTICDNLRVLLVA